METEPDHDAAALCPLATTSRAGFVDRLDSFWHQSGANRPREPESEVLEIKKAASMKDIFGEPSGTRTRDPVIKSYRIHTFDHIARSQSGDRSKCGKPVSSMGLKRIQ